MPAEALDVIASLTMALLLGPEIGQDSNVKRFCREVSILRPAQPKYDVTWDPKIVLKYLGAWFANEKLSLEKLSSKMVTLLTLTTGHRMQNLASVDVRNIRELEDQLEIKIPAQLKSAKHTKKQPSFVLPIFWDDPSVCVVSAIKQYFIKIEELRGRENKLFISWKKPHRAVTSETHTALVTWQHHQSRETAFIDRQKGLRSRRLLQSFTIERLYKTKNSLSKLS
ncbi:hypothetical protein M0804_002978 [Polistes exclamans]|nr:hypothetical protein M0804_002978 [Polistes exclamans]